MIWSQTRFSFAYAALDRFADWRAERERKKAAKELEKKRAPPTPSRWSRRSWFHAERTLARQVPASGNSARVPIPTTRL